MPLFFSCWVQNDVVFYVTVVSYIAFILLCNGSIFLVVLIQIRNMQFNQPAGTRSGILKDLRAVASLTFLLGLTWFVAFLAWGPVKVFLLYLFSILNSLQGEKRAHRMKLDSVLQANLLIFYVVICSRILHFCVPLSHEGKRT